MTVYVFDRNYRDTEQVRPFLADFLAVHAEIIAAGAYPYNDSFRGRIPGLAGADRKSEDAAIYMLQTLKETDALAVKVAAAVADGCEPMAEAPLEPMKCERIIQYGWYVGGTGWAEWNGARLVAFMDNPRSLAVLPKGKRTRGHLLAGKVLVKR